MQNMSWRAVFIAGLLGGTLFLLVALLAMPAVFGLDWQIVLSYMASVVLGSDVLTVSDTTTLIVGILVHYVLSMLFAFVIAFVVHRWGLLVGILGGAILGLSIYVINFYTTTLFFPWFFALNSSVLLAAHVVYGAVVGGIYEMFDHYDEPVKFGEVA